MMSALPETRASDSIPGSVPQVMKELTQVTPRRKRTVGVKDRESVESSFAISDIFKTASYGSKRGEKASEGQADGRGKTDGDDRLITDSWIPG